jgi:Josephin
LTNLKDSSKIIFISNISKQITMNNQIKWHDQDPSRINWIEDPKSHDINWIGQPTQTEIKSTRSNLQERIQNNPEFFNATIGAANNQLIRQNNLIDCGPSAIYNLAQISGKLDKLNLQNISSATEAITSIRFLQNHIDRNIQNNSEYFKAQDIRELLSRLFEIENTLSTNENFMTGGSLTTNPEINNCRKNIAEQISNSPNSFRGIIINKNRHFVTLIPQSGQWYLIDSLAHRANGENVRLLSNLQAKQQLVEADCYWAPKFVIKWG